MALGTCARLDCWFGLLAYWWVFKAVGSGVVLCKSTFGLGCFRERRIERAAAAEGEGGMAGGMAGRPWFVLS